MVKENKMKQTEIGLIPEEWEVRINSEISKVVDSLHATPRFIAHGYPMIRVTDIKRGNINIENCFTVSYSDFNNYNRNHKPQKNDIIISRVGSYGITIFIDRSIDVCLGQNTALISPLKCNAKYLYYSFDSNIIWNQIENESIGSGYKSLSLDNIKKLKIPLPPLAEQEAIATALSDFDAWVNSLEQVLAKKRLIKQGAMQELLTPKEDWEVKKLGEILQFGNGRDYKHLNSGNIPVYGTGGVMTYVNHYLYNGDSVGIGRKGTIDKPVYLRNKFWTVDTLFYTHSFQGVFPKYIYYQFLQIPWKEYNEASGVPSLNKNTLEQIEIKLPSLSEQTRIATTLTDMDVEIEALEKKISKARQIKQGMMQELLTGRVRLV